MCETVITQKSENMCCQTSTIVRVKHMNRAHGLLLAHTTVLPVLVSGNPIFRDLLSIRMSSKHLTLSD